ncbi:MAG: hypothetical protein WBM50_00350 [Acidimicrobiales bacterium]
MRDRRSYQSGYVLRIVDDELDHALTHPAPVLLDGPPGVGTTSIASNRARTVKHLDHRNVRRILTADPDRATGGPTPILFDQWHHHPPLWRTLTDNPGRTGPLLLTGISPDPRHRARLDPNVVTPVRVRPLTLPERLDITATVSLADLIANRPIPPTSSDLALGDYIDEIAAGGFPSYRHLDQPAVKRHLDKYLRHLIDQHLPEAGHNVRQPDALRNWLRAYATATSTTWEQIRTAANPQRPPAATTTRRYTEDLTRLRVLDPLPGWSPANSRHHHRTPRPHPTRRHPRHPPRRPRPLTADQQRRLVPRINGTLGTARLPDRTAAR